MTLRGRIFFIITAIVLVVLAISLLLLARSRNKPAPPVETGGDGGNSISQITQGVINGGGGEPVIINKPPVIKDPVALEKSAVQQIARVFIERYQTYSTDNNFDNIRQVESLVTTGLWGKLSPRLKVKPVSTGFVGVTTQALTTDLKNWADTKAAVLVQARRTTQKDGQSTTANQNYTVQMVKVNGEWLADSFTAD